MNTLQWKQCRICRRPIQNNEGIDLCPRVFCHLEDRSRKTASRENLLRQAEMAPIEEIQTTPAPEAEPTKAMEENKKQERRAIGHMELIKITSWMSERRADLEGKKTYKELAEIVGEGMERKINPTTMKNIVEGLGWKRSPAAQARIDNKGKGHRTAGYSPQKERIARLEEVVCEILIMNPRALGENIALSPGAKSLLADYKSRQSE